jgi:hypothetical protein
MATTKFKTSLALSKENLEWLNQEAALQNMLRKGGKKVSASSLIDEYITGLREASARRERILGRLLKEIQKEAVEA